MTTPERCEHGWPLGSCCEVPEVMENWSAPAGEAMRYTLRFGQLVVDPEGHWIAYHSLEAERNRLRASGTADERLRADNAVREFAMYLTQFGSVIQREKLSGIATEYLAARAPRAALSGGVPTEETER